MNPDPSTDEVEQPEPPLPVLTGAERTPAKLGEALRLFASNLPLFSAIVLSVWLPGNLLVNYLSYFVYEPDDILRTLRISIWIESVFGPIYSGALIYTLSERKQGNKVGYAKAMREGLRNWGRLFAARFVAGLYIVLGLIALVVPGVVLAVRYAFLDECVVLEDATPGEARSRSATLTEGRRWQLFLLNATFFFGYIVASALAYVPLSYVKQLDNLFVGTAIDCVFDVLYTLLNVILFLCYWEACQKEQRLERTGETGTAPDRSTFQP